MNAKENATATRQPCFLLALLFTALLSACGGGGGSGSGSAIDPATSPKTSTIAASATPAQGDDAGSGARTQRLLAEGARLNAAELDRIAKTGIVPSSKSAASSSETTGSGSVRPVPKDLSVTEGSPPKVPVYRFYNTRTGAHFYTTSEAERSQIEATLPFMHLEGIAFFASAARQAGFSPVHRFYNTQTGVHFYTISEDERAHIVATLPQFTYEGAAYYASTLSGTGYTPLYRFFVTGKGFHFYTASQIERDNIIAHLGNVYTYEGVSYYVLTADWQLPNLPHTGITSNQCYQAGNDVLTACDLSVTTSLNRQQDGHRSLISPMSFSALPLLSDGSVNYPLTECVKDNRTGLVWEGKTLTGSRAGSQSFTYLNNGLAGDASGYVNAANDGFTGSGLCGFVDWRLPTTEELMSIVNFGVNSGPSINAAAFPNTASARYWAQEPYASAPAEKAWVVGFESGYTYIEQRTNSASVRLVRGPKWSGERWIVGTYLYADDAANNVTIDRKTGLYWRRCYQGQRWDGNACSGVVATFTHEQALAEAESHSNWRMPNAKELNSLIDRSRTGPALNAAAFPGSPSRAAWSSTPDVGDSSQVWYTDSGTGWGLLSPRAVMSSNALRLVVINPTALIATPN